MEIEFSEISVLVYDVFMVLGVKYLQWIVYHIGAHIFFVPDFLNIIINNKSWFALYVISQLFSS